ncbi:alpha/beta hydrolase [Nocardia heshunensis]
MKITPRSLLPTLASVVLATSLLTTACSASKSDSPTPVSPVAAAPLPGFTEGTADNGGVAVHYVVGGHGPAVVLLHGWPETWRAWSKIAPDLAADHTVVAIDLRGFGDSGFAPKDDGGYTALAVASDVHAAVQQLQLGRIDLAGHDWGGQIALAYAARYRDEVKHLAIYEAPPGADYLGIVQAKPGVMWWDWFSKGPGDDLPERLVAGHERDFYGHFYDESAGAIDAAETGHLIDAFSRPGRTHAGFEYFRQQDVGLKEVDDLLARDGKLTIPVLGVGGERSLGPAVGSLLPRVADHPATDVVPGANHWVLEENPTYVLTALRRFLTT